jgi:hypothetical protein
MYRLTGEWVKERVTCFTIHSMLKSSNSGYLGGVMRPKSTV